MRKRESMIFLIELMIAILIFFMAASVCLLIFAKAHKMNRASQELTAASLAEQNVAELIRSAESLEDAREEIEDAYPEAVFTVKDTEMTIPFDSDLQPAEGEGTYQLTGALQEKGGMLYAELHFYTLDEDGKVSGTSFYDLNIRSAEAGSDR
ncbi:MAG: hypothetical protein LIV24_03295 [Eubacterium sp.]|nr:hypothetical protein [Eubacterium sp.]